MLHEEGEEEVVVKDCILLAAGSRKNDLPFVAKVTSLWENPQDGESNIYYNFGIIFFCTVNLFCMFSSELGSLYLITPPWIHIPI